MEIDTVCMVGIYGLIEATAASVVDSPHSSKQSHTCQWI